MKADVLMQILIASNNQYKTGELIRILKDYGINGKSYQEVLGKLQFPPETTTSFRENVNTKALFISKRLPELYVLADDSGIILDACPDKLGVVTSRQLAPYMPHYVEHMLEMVNGKSRHYTMRSFTTIAKNGKIIATGEGVLTGKLAESPRGQDRDGFDCVLIPDGLDQTLNQLPRKEWLKYAHRPKAVRQVLVKADLLKNLNNRQDDHDQYSQH